MRSYLPERAAWVPTDARWIALILTTIAIVVPQVLVKTGEVRRRSQCADNLRQFFVGLQHSSYVSSSGKFTSGAHDPWRDGCPDAVGWVADMVNSKTCRPQSRRCAANPGQGSVALLQSLGMITESLAEAAPEPLRDVGTCQTVGGGNRFTTTELADEFLAKGYGTNYAASWFLVRSAPKVSGLGSAQSVQIWYSPREQGAPLPLKSKHGSKGPLSRRQVDAAVPARLVPVIGDAAVRLGAHAPAGFIGRDGTEHVSVGAPLVDTTTAGPTDRRSQVSWQDLPGRVIVMRVAGAAKIADMIDDDTVPAGQEQPLHKSRPRRLNREASHLQDYRSFAPVHAGVANILFADGSVKTFRDVNGDGLLNPGFDSGLAPAGMKPYADDAVELPAAEVFSGILLELFEITPKMNACG